MCIISVDRQKIISYFPDADLDLIEEIIYLDGWSSYEDSAKLFIFKGIDGSVQHI